MCERQRNASSTARALGAAATTDSMAMSHLVRWSAGEGRQGRAQRWASHEARRCLASLGEAARVGTGRGEWLAKRVGRAGRAGRVGRVGRVGWAGAH